MSSRSPTDAIVGMVLHDTYRVLRKINEGGMGAVYEAEHARLKNKRYAVKVLHRSVTRVPNVYERFRREAEIASELGHPNIVDVLDFYETEDRQPYLVMEYLQGEDLACVLERRGRLPPAEVLQVMQQVGDALGAAHGQGIVHRDMKPENIFMVHAEGSQPLAKVLDFGISKIRHSKSVVTQADSVFGTPYYMSPEQAEGRVEDIDQGTDIFALGTICYQALTGELPFDAPTIPGVVYRICHTEPTPPSQRAPGLPPVVDAVLSRALAKDRRQRFQQTSELVHALQVALADAEALPAAQPVSDELAQRPIPDSGAEPTAAVDAGPTVKPTVKPTLKRPRRPKKPARKRRRDRMFNDL